MLSTPPLAPKLIQALQHEGIHTRADLLQAGAVSAFLRLKAQGHTLTQSALWALAAAAEGCMPAQIDARQRTELLSQLKQHPPVAPRPSEAEMTYFLGLAQEEAELAFAANEVPVGAIVVKNGAVIGRGFNQCISNQFVAQHAELVALAEAGATLGNYRLDDCDLYVTLEPCPMCASALTQARIRRVIYAAAEPKMGAAGSVINLFHHSLNKHTAIFGPIATASDASVALLQSFFQRQRRQR
ncbi:MAG: tRNA-specific adenosine deaminase [Neisseriaceae bacterium]|nr:tRNA-specific adenosine deaminase [Neisseriaceae bacterium]MBP6861135.1 tRNA-specific adenosine deaminase [Neisseriaceae bacterium]